MSNTADLAERLAEIRARIARAAERAGRKADAVHLIAISKTHGADAIAAAIAAGQLLFGENRVQEAEGKFPRLKLAHPALRLHLVGPLQTNKAANAVALFDAIQSLDRPKLATVLAKEMEKQGRRPDLFIQVNTGAEPQKAGVLPGDCEALLKLARDELKLPVVGLMCIPPVDQPPAPHFALLADLARRFNLPQLSMGMSGDFEEAIQAGATFVRVGTAIFGER